MVTPIQTSIAFAEHTTLPHIQLLDKKGTLQCSAYVNAFAVTREQDWYARPNGSSQSRRWAHGLWYLSLLGEPGSGTTLQAIYGGATENNAAHRLSLEGIGEVVLGNYREELVSRGYATHWNYIQQPIVLPSLSSASAGQAHGEHTKPRAIRALHGILEPRQLTVADPLRASLTGPRRRATKGERGRKRKEEAVLSTGQAEAADPETRRMAAEQPCFLLLIPGYRQDDPAFRQDLFLSFLSRRLPWPLKQEWAEQLWEACLSTGMIEHLVVWSYGLPLPGHHKAAATLPAGLSPILADSYLCTPQPAHLATVVEHLVTSRSFALPQRATLRPAA